jgi:hypothetical protein
MLPLILGGLGAATGILGGLFGASEEQKKREQAERLLREAMEQYDGMVPPEIQAYADQLLGPSAEAGVTSDPRYVQSQEDVLAKLQGISNEGGMDIQSQAALNDALRQTSQQEYSTRQRILDDMRRRGQGGSNQALVAQLVGAQAQADRAQSAGLNAAAASRQRALQALQQSGQLAGQLRGQDFSERTQAARAQDEINRYNAMARERGAQYRNALIQQQYQQRMQLANAKAGALTGQANAARADGQAANQAIGQITGGIGYGLGAAGQYFANQEAEDARRKKGY